ncbi:MAG TPA: hypothetical protein VGI20_05680 [Rhizomicrobium sp.]|jgi:hypothetical protein
MHIVIANALAAAIAGTVAAAPASLMEASPWLEKPVKIVRAPLPRDPDNPQAKAELSCTYYPHFAVKQIDLGEIGADQLSILPAGAPCRKDNSANEKVVSANDWTGYFEGAKGDYIIFDAEDGWNDGLGFAVFTPEGRRLFEDVARKWKGIELRPSGVALRYVRVYEAPCTLEVDADACWQKIRKATGLTDASPPDCRAAYVREQKRTPQLARQVLNDPTIVDYEVVATIGANSRTVTAATGKALRCRPAE